MQNETSQKNMAMYKQNRSPGGFYSEVAKPHITARTALETQKSAV